MTIKSPANIEKPATRNPMPNCNKPVIKLDDIKNGAPTMLTQQTINPATMNTSASR